MADIYDTLHPVNTPADNLYPNIKPEQNIPDASISKQKLNFSIGGQGAAAILPGEEYVDIAYNGNPGSVLFPKGTYFIYTRDGWLNNTPPYTGSYNTVSDDFEVMAYWYDVSENVIKSSEAAPSDDGIILSIPEDDFLVMVLIRNPNENGPSVIPVYSIIPTSLIKYNTRDYDWAALQVTGFTINDGEYPQLGSGYLVDQFSTPIVSANTNYYKICNMKILSADIGRNIVSASAIVWIAATTGSTINTAFVSLNLVMDTLTQDYSASGATLMGGAFDAGKLVYTIEFDSDQSELTITLYAALAKDAMMAAGNVCYVRYRDAQGDRQSTVPFFYGTDTGSASAPSNSIPVKQIGTAFNPEGVYPNLGAGKDGDGNQISTTYAKQTGSYPTLGAGYLVDSNVSARQSTVLGWHKVLEIAANKVGNTDSATYSGLLLINGIRGSADESQLPIAGSSIVEIDTRLRNASAFFTNRLVINVLNGYLDNNSICGSFNSDGSVLSIYLNLSVQFMQYNIAKLFESAENVKAHVSAITFTDEFYGTTAPKGAVYAVVRNNASTAESDGDGNVISETYAPLGSPAFTGTPTAPTPDTSDNSTRIATTQWVKQQGGAAMAYHHHIQAAVSTPVGEQMNSVELIFTLINTDPNPITTVQGLYDSLLALPWTTRETRWTPCNGGVWLHAKVDDWGAWPVVAVRALSDASTGAQIQAFCYRIGYAALEGPFKQYPFPMDTAEGSVLDVVTDQYSNYVAGQ